MNFRFTAALIVNDKGNLEMHVNSQIALRVLGTRYEKGSSLPTIVRELFIDKVKRPTSENALEALHAMQDFLDKGENARKPKTIKKKTK